MSQTVGEPRLVRFSQGGSPAVGVVVGHDVDELRAGWKEALGLLADGDHHRLSALRAGSPVPLTSVELLATVEEDSDVYCVGLNYFDHQQEAAELVDRVRDVPIIFAKSHRALAAPNAELVLPVGVSSEFDWEAELGAVIGHDAIDVDPANAWEVVAGYCVINDVTARDLQKRHQQWHLGKNIPASSPVGPWVVGRHALTTPPDISVTLLVNGVEKQRANTSALIHEVPDLVALLSRVTTLRAGDVIATGTPAGVGFKRDPPEYLRDGDVVETVVQGVGRLTNVVRTVARGTSSPALEASGSSHP
jgi:2-keto-4-pentenoate hydratase/2-oxohepta-3-ene-1,7-dioic acid hydratase in catechol pathway